MRRLMYLLGPILLCALSVALIWLGQYVYAYRDHLHTSDPTGYHVNDVVSFWILAPAIIAFFLSGFTVIRRVSTTLKQGVITAEKE